MLQAADASAAAGNFTLRGMAHQLAFKAPEAYLWLLRTFPTVLSVANSTVVSGAGATATGTVALNSGAALTSAQVGAAGAGMLASAYLGFLVGAAAYASLRLRGFDFGAEGTSAADFFAWQSSSSNLGFFDWYSGAYAAEQQSEDMQYRIAKQKSQTARALAATEARHGIKVPAGIHAKLKSL